MADAWTIEIPLNAKDSDMKRAGEKMAEAFMNRVGMGGGLKAASTGGKETSMGEDIVGGIMKKMMGTLAVIAMIWEGLEPIIKPVFSLLKIILTLLFLPLIPILKPILILLGALAKALAPEMKAMSKGIDQLIKTSLGPLLEAIPMIASALGKFNGKVVEIFFTFLNILVAAMPSIVPAIAKGLEVLATILNWATQNLDKILTPLTELFKWVGDNMQSIWDTVFGIFDWAIKTLTDNWGTIKSILDWVTGFMQTGWNTFKTILDNLIQSIMPTMTDVATKLANVFIDIWNALQSVLKTVTFGLAGGGSIAKIATGVGFGGGNMSGHGAGRDFILRPNGQMIQTASDDFIIGMKNPGKIMGGGANVTINIDSPVVRNDSDIRKLADAVSIQLQRTLSGRLHA